MKKLIVGIALIIIAFATFRYSLFRFVSTAPTPSPTENKQAVSVIINFGGENIATYSAINTATAFDALDQVTKDNAIPLSVKEYSFGKLVEKIGEKENTKDMAWIFYVNGKSADKGADQFEVHDGDVVEWKYIKPTY